MTGVLTLVSAEEARKALKNPGTAAYPGEVILVGNSPQDDFFNMAVAIGAKRVVFLPDALPWLTERINELNATSGDLLPYTAVTEGCGYFTILDAGGNPQQYHATRAEAHDDFDLPMDCAHCAAGEAAKHQYEEPTLGSDLTDCLDSCEQSVTHEGPC